MSSNILCFMCHRGCLLYPYIFQLIGMDRGVICQPGPGKEWLFEVFSIQRRYINLSTGINNNEVKMIPIPYTALLLLNTNSKIFHSFTITSMIDRKLWKTIKYISYKATYKCNKCLRGVLQKAVSHNFMSHLPGSRRPHELYLIRSWWPPTVSLMKYRWLSARVQ